MANEIRNLYVVRVEDLMPISGDRLIDCVDPSELVYVVERTDKGSVVVDLDEVERFRHAA